jgi:hypothetical protein
VTCEHLAGNRVCGSISGVRAYVTGLCCPDHTPAAVAGRTDYLPDPAATLDALRERAGQTWSLHVQQHRGRNVR